MSSGECRLTAVRRPNVLPFFASRRCYLGNLGKETLALRAKLLNLWEDKTRKEAEKLEAETREINSRLESKPSYWDKSKERVIFLTALVTLGAGGWGLYATVNEYFHQREQEAEQAEREYTFTVNKEMIDLSQQLASKKSEVRHHAALLLSAFEEDAVPILVANLRLTDKGDLPEQVTKALELVLSKEKSKDKKKQKERIERILSYIGDEAEAFLEDQYLRNNYDFLAIRNFIVALGKLGARSPSVIRPALNRMKAKLADSESRITADDRETLESWIKESLDNLKQANGPGS